MMVEAHSPLFGKSLYEALFGAFFAGFYLALFYTFNNLTMLRTDGILILFVLAILPVMVLTLLIYAAFHYLDQERRATAAIVFVLSAYLVFMLHPALQGIEYVRHFFAAFGEQYVLANCLFVLLPSALLAFIFQRKMDVYATLLGFLAVTALVMGFYGLATATSPLARSGSAGAEYQQVFFRERPNIYFILSDAFGSFAFMQDQGIDVTEFSGFLEERGFRLYNDTYSNYQPTTSAMPAMLNMAHHYYTLNEARAHFSEVSSAARRIIGGDNNVSHILRNNGYTIQYVHGGTYLLLQGCSADHCFPELDPLVGVKIILSHVFQRSLLTAADTVSSYNSLAETRAEVARLLSDAGTSPRFQYIHAFTPNHSPNNMAGRCDEVLELENYAKRLESASKYLREQLEDILASDPDAVILLAGDHGPFLANQCAPLGLLDNVEDYRDRTGILTAIRWPRSYAGEFDERIVSGVNLFRYLLASLAMNPAPLLDSVVSDDVFIRDARLRPHIIIKGGQPLSEPQPIQVRFINK